jgi:RNA polymerase sigma-70 factor, ECF subfamily
MNDVDDSGLLERARRGDEVAFSQLFDRYQHDIFRYAVHMCGAECGDDIVQETFLAVLRQRDRTDPPDRGVAVYLLGIARHLVLQRLGSKYEPAIEQQEDDGELVADGSTVLDDLTRAETITAVRAAVRSLPPVYREVVVLCDLQDMDYAQAARALQCPVGTVRSRLSRARALLMAKLSAAHSPASARKG